MIECKIQHLFTVDTCSMSQVNQKYFKQIQIFLLKCLGQKKCLFTILIKLIDKLLISKNYTKFTIYYYWIILYSQTLLISTLIIQKPL